MNTYVKDDGGMAYADNGDTILIHSLFACRLWPWMLLSSRIAKQCSMHAPTTTCIVPSASSSAAWPAFRHVDVRATCTPLHPTRPTGVCKKNAGQLTSLKLPVPLTPIQSNVDCVHHESAERAKKKLEVATAQKDSLFNFGQMGVRGASGH